MVLKTSIDWKKTSLLFRIFYKPINLFSLLNKCFTNPTQSGLGLADIWFSSISISRTASVILLSLIDTRWPEIFLEPRWKLETLLKSYASIIGSSLRRKRVKSISRLDWRERN